MKDKFHEIVWKRADPEKSFAFWEDYFNKIPQIPLANHQNETEVKPFTVEDPSLFLGTPVIRESWVPDELKLAEIGDLLYSNTSPCVVEENKRSQFPYSAVGKLLYTLDVNGKVRPFEGSAFVLNTKKNTAIFTAAHCLFSERSLEFPRQWAQNIIFIPFFGNNNWTLQDYFQSNEVYFAQGLGVAKKWYDSGSNNRYEYDLGCFLVAEGEKSLKERTGALGWIAGDFITDNYLFGQSIGYPRGLKFNRQNLWRTNVQISYQHYVTGFPHIRMKGNQFSKGASGGSVVVSSPNNPLNFFAVGLNALISSYSPDFVYWDAPRFGQTFIAMIQYLEELV